MQRLALLTSDTGFVDGLCQVEARGTAVIAILPRTLFASKITVDWFTNISWPCEVRSRRLPESTSWRA